MVKKILVADDMVTVVKMVRYILEEEGYAVITASDGIEATKKVYQEMPDLVILDLLMPRMNGYQVCRLLKNDDLTSHIPIIIFTSQDKPVDKFWAKQTGADEYLLKDSVKCFESPELIKTLDKLFQSNIQKKTKEISKRHIDEAEIFTKVNELLDKNLFQSTVLNKISYLSRSIYDQGNTMQSLLKLLQDIIKFEIGLILLGEEKNMLIYSKEKQSNENKEKAVHAALDNFNQLAGRKISKDELNIKITSVENIPINVNQPLNSFLFSEFYTKNAVMGILLIGSCQENAYSDTDKKLLNSFVTQASIVMDNTRLYQKLESLSITDELTGMYNKRYLSQIIPQELNRVERYNRILSVIMFDIDFFKRVNDVYGHIQGDIILREVAGITMEILRKVDIPVRYGGEEFVILLPEINLKAAENIAERLRKAVEQFSFHGQKEPLHITISLGVGICTKELVDEEGKKLIAAVDAALYEAKKSGRNMVCTAKK
ncbi:MAG: diguanylate cyclase [bacterium]